MGPGHGVPSFARQLGASVPVGQGWQPEGPWGGSIPLGDAVSVLTGTSQLRLLRAWQEPLRKLRSFWNQRLSEALARWLWAGSFRGDEGGARGGIVLWILPSLT